MMGEPGAGPAGYGQRASDADRGQAVERLKTAFADGTLARHEFDRRMALALVTMVLHPARRADLDR